MRKLEYEYYFVPQGTTRESHGDFKNEIWLDVGNRIEKGTFDHHGCMEKSINSTVGLLFEMPELLAETVNSINGKEKVRIYLHREPDTDTIFAVYFFKQFAEIEDTTSIKKSIIDFKKTKVGEKIIQFVNEIDQGDKDGIGEKTLYSHICKLDDEKLREYWGTKTAVEGFNKAIETGLLWVEEAIAKIREDDSFSIKKGEFSPNDEVGKIIRDEFPDEELASVVEERKKTEGKQTPTECYENDKKQGRLYIKNIELWKKNGSTEIVKAAIWNTIPSDPDSSYREAREEGAVVTFVPQKERQNNTDVIISLNKKSNKKGSSKEESDSDYSLKEVGEIYELMEQIYDKAFMERNGIMRRNYSRPRGDGKSKIFTSKPFSATSDPWYVSTSCDQVAAPKVGSGLSISQMIEILENITRMIKKSFVMSYDLKASQTDEHKYPNEEQIKGDKTEEQKDMPLPVELKPNEEVGNKSLFSWCQKVKKNAKTISREGKYPLVIAEVDSQLLSYSDDILKEVFMNLSDGAFLDADANSVLKLDYRTHIFVNQGIAAIFVATSDFTDNTKLLDGMLDMSTNNSIKDSSIISIFSKILYQREKYKEIGKFIGDFADHKRDIKSKRKELIMLLAGAQADECFNTQVELDCYKFISNALNVPELKGSLKESMEMISGYSQESVYGGMDFLSRITIPFVLIGTLFQIGALRFGPMLDVAAEKSFTAWTIISLLTLVITALLFFIRRE